MESDTRQPYTQTYLPNKDLHDIERGHIFLQGQWQVVEREGGPGGGGGVRGRGGRRGRRGRHDGLYMSMVLGKQEEGE
jgi:hypothetical protein